MFLLLEYCSNGNLFNYLRSEKNQKLSRTQLMNIFIKVCESVAFMHANKMIHRDIKPENILLDSTLNPKLCDFGWSIELKKNEKRQTFCGTYEYMAPEIFESENYFSAVDVWSLGILLFELFHGHSPFVGSSIFNIYKNIIKENIQFAPDFDPEAQDLVCRILKLNPSERLTVNEILCHPFMERYKIIIKQAETQNPKTSREEQSKLEEPSLRKQNAFTKKNPDQKNKQNSSKIGGKISDDDISPHAMVSNTSKEYLHKGKQSNILFPKNYLDAVKQNRIFKTGQKPGAMKPSFASAFRKSKKSPTKFMDETRLLDTEGNTINEEIFETLEGSEDPDSKLVPNHIDFCKKTTSLFQKIKHKAVKLSNVGSSEYPKVKKSGLLNSARKPLILSSLVPSKLSYYKNSSQEQLNTSLSKNENVPAHRQNSTIYDSLARIKTRKENGLFSKNKTLANDYKDIYQQTAEGILTINSSRNHPSGDFKNMLKEQLHPVTSESTELNKKNFTSFVSSNFNQKLQSSSKKVLSTSMLFKSGKKSLNNKVKSSEKLQLTHEINESNLYSQATAPNDVFDNNHYKTFTKSNSIQTEKFKLAKNFNNDLIYSTSISNKIQAGKNGILSKYIANKNSMLRNSEEDIEDVKSDSSGDRVVMDTGKTKVIVKNVFSSQKEQPGIGLATNAKQNFNITINQYYQKTDSGVDTNAKVTRVSDF